MTEPQAIIYIQKFTTDTGNPTCSNDCDTGNCMFLMFSHFGSRPVCGFPRMRDKLIKRAPDRCTGWLTPHDECPVWNQPK